MMAVCPPSRDSMELSHPTRSLLFQEVPLILQGVNENGNDCCHPSYVLCPPSVMCVLPLQHASCVLLHLLLYASVFQVSARELSTWPGLDCGWLLLNVQGRKKKFMEIEVWTEESDKRGVLSFLPCLGLS